VKETRANVLAQLKQLNMANLITKKELDSKVEILDRKCQELQQAG